MMRPSVTPRHIHVREPYDSAPHFSAVLEELEPTLAEGAYAVTEAARDLLAFIELSEGEHCNARENRRRLRTRPSEFVTAVPELSETLARLLKVVRAEDTSGGHLKDVAALAHKVVIWAEARGAFATALIFAQLAQEADEDSGTTDPRLTYDLGRLAAAVPELRADGVAWLEHAREHAGAAGHHDLADSAAALIAAVGSAA